MRACVRRALETGADVTQSGVVVASVGEQLACVPPSIVLALV